MNRIGHFTQAGNNAILINAQLPLTGLALFYYVSMTGNNQTDTAFGQACNGINQFGCAGAILLQPCLPMWQNGRTGF